VTTRLICKSIMVVTVEVQPVEGELNDGEEEAAHVEAQELPNELYHHSDPGRQENGKNPVKEVGMPDLISKLSSKREEMGGVRGKEGGGATMPATKVGPRNPELL
jgi:hypothetical protein